MASTKFSYQKLRKIPILSTQHECQEEVEEDVARRNNSSSSSRSSRWLRLRSGVRRRRRIRVVGLRRFIRRKARVVSGAVKKLMKRLKEGRPYLGELFAGNYMFMQVAPTPTNNNSKNNYYYSFLPGGGQHHAIADKFNMNNNPKILLS